VLGLGQGLRVLLELLFEPRLGSVDQSEIVR
jgi:hypothetical protein